MKRKPEETLTLTLLGNHLRSHLKPMFCQHLPLFSFPNKKLLHPFVKVGKGWSQNIFSNQAHETTLTPRKAFLPVFSVRLQLCDKCFYCPLNSFPPCASILPTVRCKICWKLRGSVLYWHKERHTKGNRHYAISGHFYLHLRVGMMAAILGPWGNSGKRQTNLL